MTKEYVVIKQVADDDAVIVARCAYAAHAEMIYHDCVKRWPKEVYAICLR